MITNPTDAPTIIDYHNQQAQAHYDRPRGTCLGAGVCQWCGWPLGWVRQRSRWGRRELWRNYHNNKRGMR